MSTIEEHITWVPDRWGILRARPGSAMRAPGQCVGCGTVFDTARVTVTARYADCSMWDCPGCGRQHDSRSLGGANPAYRQGYIDLSRERDR